MLRQLGNVDRKLRADARTACELRQAEVQSTYEASWSRFTGEVRRRLSVSSPKPDVSTRTWDLLEGLTHGPPPKLAIFVTDGIETPSRHGIPALTLPAGMRVLLLLVPPDPAYAAPADAIGNVAHWRKAIPGLEAVFSTEVHAGLWQQVCR
jgi:hypothetical protein